MREFKQKKRERKLSLNKPVAVLYQMMDPGWSSYSDTNTSHVSIQAGLDEASLKAQVYFNPNRFHFIFSLLTKQLS